MLKVEENKKNIFQYDDIRNQVEKMLSIDILIKEEDNLLEMGLNSMKIMRLVNSWRKKGFNINFSKMISSPYLKNWFKMLNDNIEVINEKDNNVDKIDMFKPFPLTDVQYAYWIGRRSEQILGGIGCHAYFEIDGKYVNHTRLEKAWVKLQKHHSMLRTRFLSKGQQEILKEPYSKKVTLYDLKTYTEDEVNAKLENIREKISHRSLDIENGQVAELALSILPNNNTRIHFDIDLLVADMQSLQIIFRDLYLLYEEKSEPLAPRDWKFSNYLKKEKKNKDIEEKKAKVYWNEILETLPKAPLVPLAKQPKDIKSPVFRRRQYFLDNIEWELLKKVASKKQVTPAMVLLTAYAEIIDRWSESSKFLINVPLFNRETGEVGIDDVIADFTNILLFPVDCSNKESFSTRLKNIETEFYKKMAYSSYSGVRVQRDMARIHEGEKFFAPFVFSCNYGSPLIDDKFNNILGKLSYMISQTPQVWVDFQIFEINNGLQLAWDCIDELFPEGLIDEMFTSYVNLIKELIKNEETLEKCHDVLPNLYKERTKESVITSNSLKDEGLHTAFFKNALVNGDDIALIDSNTNKNYSYEYLSKYALKIASYLKESGVSEKDLVSVSLPRGVDQIASILGILSLGACYVPININQPKSRRDNIHKKGSIKYVITNTELKESISWPLNIKVLDVSDSKNNHPLDKTVSISPENSAYIIFTSGSTGEPKGVEISHRAALNTINDINDRYNVSSKDSILAVSSFDFDLSVYDIFGLLSAGGTIVLITEDTKRDSSNWLELINKYKITMWNSVPTLLNMLLIVAESINEKIPTLRLIILSGDWISLDLPKRIKAIAENSHLLAMGGATEASIWSNFYDVTLPLPNEWKSIPYGKPLTNQIYRVVDNKGRDCPNWVPGELWIGGAGVAKGYIGDPEITQKSFKKWNNISWYKTGDMGRFFKDGNIEFLGRRDFQVKIRGHRIELPEIETAIRKYPGVDNAIVTAVGDTYGNKHLVGYIVPDKNSKTDLFLEENTIDRKELTDLWNNVTSCIENFDYKNLHENIRPIDYPIFQKYIDKISISYICSILNNIGSYCKKDDKYTIDDILNKCEIIMDYKELIKQWMESLVSEDLVKKDREGTFINLQNLSCILKNDFKIDNKYLKFKSYIDNLVNFLNQFEKNSVDILKGKFDPLKMFISDEYISPDEYVNTLPGGEYKQQILINLINFIKENTFTDKPLNILEVGARNIDQTKAYLSNFNSKDINYTCTDQSTYYINKAFENLKEFQNVQYKQLDINKNPINQGYSGHNYDVIIASNSLHRSYNIEDAIGNVRSLMKPGGILIMLEMTNNTIMQQITTGFLERGFVDFEDNRKTNKLPLLSADKWQNIIESQQFVKTTVLPKEDKTYRIFNQNIIIAQGPYTIKKFNQEILKNFLNSMLPSYMIPSNFMILEKLSLTSNGKIDRKKLPSVDFNNKEEDNNIFISPRTEIEVSLSEIWREVLQINKVSINDNYFELGGDSLLATKLNVMINKKFNIELPLEVIFEKSVFYEQAMRIGSLLEDTEVKNLSVEQLEQIKPDKEKWNEPFPLTDVQQSYWFGRNGGFSLGDVSTHCYFEMDCEDIDLEGVKRIWHQLIKRHGMMRATISTDGMYQKIHESISSYKIKVYDFTKKDIKDREIEIKKVREEMSHQTFSTDKWPLFDLRISVFNDKFLRLHISFDNIIFDGWSMFYILREWKQLYEDENSVSDIDVSFRDYVMTYEKIKKTDKFKDDMEYWKKRLPNIAPAPDLPLLKNPNNLVKQRFSRLESRLSCEKWQDIKKKASKYGLTPSGLLLSAYAETIARWSKSSKFTINLTRFNRLPLHPQIMNVVGDFTSLTLLSVDNSKGNTFIERCKNLQKQLLEDLAHPYVSGVDIERELSKKHRKQQEAIMPIVFTSGLGIKHQGNKNENEEYLGKITYGLSQTPQVWIDHQVTEQDGELVLTWDVVKDIFPAGLVDDMFKGYCYLLNSLSNDNIWVKSTKNLISTPRVNKIIKENNIEKEISSETLTSLFEKQVFENKEKVAVISSKGNLTYSELYSYSKGIGNLLIEKGIGKDKLVAIIMEKGWEQICAVMGILKSGGAYLPIDPNNPEDRINLLLKDANVDFVLTQSEVSEKIHYLDNIQYINVDELDISMINTSEINYKSNSEDLAYVIYTSGSTGKPKGVMINHKGVVNTILDINNRFMVCETDKTIALSNLNFDLSVYDVFGTLSAGGTIVIPDPDKVKEPSYWIELIQKENITIWNTVPAFMQMLTEYALNIDDFKLSSLRLVMLSGDWIPLDLPDKIKKHSKNVKVISLGGATEASIWSNLYPVEEIAENWSSIPYGKPMINQKFYIFNEFMLDCPVWVPGRLFIGGTGLAKGYLNDDIKTKERFIYHQDTGERLYYTGDLGRYLPDGNIEFLGREDTQVKIRGHRIELGEVETILKNNDKVKNSIVMVEKNIGDLEAAVTLEEDVINENDEIVEELHQFLIKQLPEYLIPNKIIVLDKFPLNNNGKVDRKAIKKIFSEHKSIENNKFEEPHDGLERKIADIWEEVLNVTNISRNDDFFLCGGDSLKAVSIIGKLREKQIYPEGLSLQIIFSSSTIALLAEKINHLYTLKKNSENLEFEEGIL